MIGQQYRAHTPALLHQRHLSLCSWWSFGLQSAPQFVLVGMLKELLPSGGTCFR